MGKLWNAASTLEEWGLAEAVEAAGFAGFVEFVGAADFVGDSVLGLNVDQDR